MSNLTHFEDAQRLYQLGELVVVGSDLHMTITSRGTPGPGDVYGGDGRYFVVEHVAGEEYPDADGVTTRVVVVRELKPKGAADEGRNDGDAA